MTRWQRIKNVLGGLCTLAFIPLLLLDKQLGCALIVLAMGVAAALRGLRMLLYYASMARHTVGGRIVLYLGIICLDFGVFTVGFADVPGQYIMVYLMVGYLFYGLVQLLRAMELRRLELGIWRMKLLAGLADLVLGALCLIRIHSSSTTVYLYCLGLALSGIGRIASAFRPSGVVYVAQP